MSANKTRIIMLTILVYNVAFITLTHALSATRKPVGKSMNNHCRISRWFLPDMNYDITEENINSSCLRAFICITDVAAAEHSVSRDILWYNMSARISYKCVTSSTFNNCMRVSGSNHRCRNGKKKVSYTAEIARVGGHYAIQGHSRSLVLVVIEIPCATSY